MASTISFRDVQDAVYRRMRETDSRLLNGSDVKFWINEVYSETLKERHYRFMDVTVNFVTSIDTYLAEDITSANTDFDVSDASGLPASGKIIVNNDIITYTSIVGNNLQGVTGIGGNHDSGTVARRVYQLSELSITNFDKPIFLGVNDSEIMYYDNRAGFNGTGYSLTATNDFILPFNTTVKPAVLIYKKLITRLVNNSDLFLIPDDYIGLVIEYAIYKAKLDLGYDDTSNHYMEYKRIKKLMKADFTEATENKYKQLKSVYQDDFYSNPNMSDY